jgi:hypothetical protein
MQATDRLDRTATETMLLFLAHRFGLKPVRFRITNRSANHGTYFPNMIRVSRNAEAWVVMHEFAHHLDREINGGVYRAYLYGEINGMRYRRPHTQALHHSEAFYFNLKRIVGAIGCADYPWTKEYKQIKRWAVRDGLVQAS